MPVPKKGESEKDFVSRCIPFVIHEGTTKDSSQAAAICHSIYRKKKNMKNESTKERVLLELNSCSTLSPVFEIDDPDKDEYSIGLTESTILVGDGIYNGIFFPADEIEKAFMSWDKQPININHSSAIEDEVGYITKPYYDKVTKQFKVTPVLNKETANYDVASGYINNRVKAGKPPEVSVGVWVDKEYELMDDGDERLVARNLVGDHLALVCRGACSPEAGCGIGLEHDKSVDTYNIELDNDYAHFTVELNESGDDEKLRKDILREKIKKEKLQMEE